MGVKEWKTLAAALATARSTGRADVKLPENHLPNLAAAEAVREVASTLFGRKLCGYKIGATSPESQKMLGCDGPFYGPLFENECWKSGTETAITNGLRGVECEYAFRLKEDLPAREQPYSRYDVAAAIGSCHPALELVGRRTRGEGLPSLFAAVADFALNAGFIFGAKIKDWQIADLENGHIIGRVEGKVANFGQGSNVLGHPLNAVAWLANKRSDEGGGLQAGDWILSGSCLGLLPIHNGVTVSGDFGRLGGVSVHFS